MSLAETTRQVHMDPDEGRKLRFIADLITVKATTADTGGAYTLIETETPPAGGLPLHAQSYDDATYYILEGTFRFCAGNDEFELGVGGYTFVPRGTAHGYVNAGNGTARMLALASPGGVWERFIDEIGDVADRMSWAIDMARVLAIAPKYGIAFEATHSGGDAGGAPE